MTTPLRHRSTLLPSGVDQFDALNEMVAAHAGPDSVVLDVGAGDGRQAYSMWLRSIAARIVGVDPSVRILANEQADERHQSTLEQFASAHPHVFDLAVLCYVVEHVLTPDRFLAALHHCLKPGGSAFVLTPHVLHYFGASAFLARRLHVDEWVLRHARDEATLRDWHVRVQYRMNSRHRLARLAGSAGFRHLEFHMLDDPGIYQPYLPERLRPVPVIWSRVAHRLDAPALAGTMLARLEA